MKKLITTVMAAFTLLLQTNVQAQQTATTVQDIAKLTEMLPGSWEWTESRFASRGVKPTLKTPASENKNVTINFRPDNLASVYVNKKFSGMYQYTLTQPTNDYVMITFKANEGQPLPEFLQDGPLSINDNEIFIAGGYNDAGQNVKFRKAGTKPTPPKAAAPATKAVPAKKGVPAKKAVPAKPATKTKTKVKTEAK